MLMIKAAVLALVLCVFTLVLKRDQPSFAFLASSCGAACLLALAIGQLQPLAEWLHTLAGFGLGTNAACILRVLGIAIVAQLAADLCRESGLAAAASAVELCGRMLALLQALPLVQALLDAFSGFLR